MVIKKMVIKKILEFAKKRFRQRFQSRTPAGIRKNRVIL